jgi:hypothetical protein
MSLMIVRVTGVLSLSSSQVDYKVRNTVLYLLLAVLVFPGP